MVEYTIDNFKYHYSKVIDETMDIMYDDEITSKNIEIYIIYALTGCLVVLATFINIFGNIDNIIFIKILILLNFFFFTY